MTSIEQPTCSERKRYTITLGEAILLGQWDPHCIFDTISVPDATYWTGKES